MMSKEKDEELIWKFLDGDLTHDEESLVEEKLELDEQFRAQMADIRDLDALLAGRTAELPSLRFATAVMEQVQQGKTAGLSFSMLPQRLLRWYLASMGAMLLVLLVVMANLNGSPVTFSTGTLEIAETMSQILAKPYMQLFFQVSIGISLLILLDYRLRKRKTAQFSSK